ncbi:MAG: ABC transporter ATP-binding protein [Lachnospiraceae bacterium]|nr:ABC transporter ATP-binding protein [Lachnospiraceae bacterium]
MKEFVTVKNLTKNYGEFTAVDDLSFEVEEGEVFGLLGPNGAGKSTTLSIITTLLSGDKGKVMVAGVDVKKDKMEAKKLMGIVPQEIALYPHLTAIENVKFFASLYGLRGKKLEEEARRALDFVGLSEHNKEKPKKMSGGMQRRLNIACGIAHRPRLIVMDEPTVGVDAQSREHILNSIRTLKEHGTTIIYTSHYLQEVEEICDRIAIMDHGKLVAAGTKDELVGLVTDYKSFYITTAQKVEDFDELKQAISFLPGIKNITIKEDTTRVDINNGEDSLSKILSIFMKRGLTITNVNGEVPNFDTVFLALTGHELR